MAMIIFSSAPYRRDLGLVLIRVLTGLLLAYHGLEIFSPAKIAEYAAWDKIRVLPAPLLWAYVGKGLEFFAGLLLALGLLTRLASLFIIADMLFICFYIGSGKFYYEDQHPFLFAVLALVFFFTGPVQYSLDQRFAGRSDFPTPSNTHR